MPVAAHLAYPSTKEPLGVYAPWPLSPYCTVAAIGLQFHCLHSPCKKPLRLLRQIRGVSSHCEPTHDGFICLCVRLRRVPHQGNTHLHQRNTHIGGKPCRIGEFRTEARRKPTSSLRKQFPKPAQISLVSPTICSYLPAMGGVFADKALRSGDNPKALPTVSLFLISRNHSDVRPCDIRMWVLRQPCSDTGQFSGNIRIIAVFNVW